MKVVFLAAGYGTRLERDIRNDANYSYLLGVPKPLLPIGHKPLLSHWIETFNRIPEVDKVVVVVNDLHKDLYYEWSKTLSRNVTIVNDGSKCNEQRPGAVACMQIGVQDCLQDTLFIAGDTLLKDDFDLQSMLKRFNSLKEQRNDACLIISAPVAEENVSKHGIIEVDRDGRVTGFVEKPLPSETKSRLQCPCFYIVSAAGLHHLKDFLVEKKDEPLRSRDLTGLFISVLIHKAPVYAYHVEGRYDVGGLQSYVQCHQDFLAKDQ